MTVFLILIVNIIAALAEPACDQLVNFKKETLGPIGTLTNTDGCPVEYRDTVALDSPNLLRNGFFMDIITGFVRERIPERVVHAKGAGAFGYFEVTHNVTDICKAKLFSRVGKKTPVVVRFSHSSLDKGEPDTSRDSKGFAVKFYTEDGNFDIVGFNTPMFMAKDPLLFVHIMRAVKRNPVTNFLDRTMIWDLMTLRPELVFFFMYLFGDRVFPSGYRHMPGYNIHTYQVVNDRGEFYFVRFHFTPDAGVQNLSLEDALKKKGTDPDFLAKGLYNEIGNGDFPTWTLSVHVLTIEDIREADFDVFDLTKILPLDKYPLRPIGKLVLNRNPRNYFADVEQVAFCPANLVPGILGAPDKMFEARLLAYREAHANRLGVNVNQIKVNCPFSNRLSLNLDGRPPFGEHGRDSPSYFPNTFNGPRPYGDAKTPDLITLRQEDDSYNFKQASQWFHDLSADARERLVTNMVYSSLSKVNEALRKRAIQLFTSVNSEFGYMIAEELQSYPLKSGQSSD